MLTVVLSISTLTLAGLLYRTSRKCEHQAASFERERSEWATFTRRADAAWRELDSLRIRLVDIAPSPIHPLYIKQLHKLGLDQPVEDLIEDLQRHPELIPYAGVLGGRMSFADRDRIRVLSGSWVYATFEDGHIAGEGIFEYEVGVGGDITWRVVTAQKL
jgi:hypothetical protein